MSRWFLSPSPLRSSLKTASAVPCQNLTVHNTSPVVTCKDIKLFLRLRKPVPVGLKPFFNLIFETDTPTDCLDRCIGAITSDHQVSRTAINK